MTDQRLVSDVKASEGCRLVAYKDSLGLWTIGWGHLLDQSIDWEGQEWTQETADAQLANDLDEADEQAQNLPEMAGLNACRTNAVIELVFNMGLHHWLPFEKCRQALHEARWQDAHDELLRSKWVGEVGPHRSQRLAGYFLTGSY